MEMSMHNIFTRQRCRFPFRWIIQVYVLCLIWSSMVTAEAAKSAADYYVTHLPGAPLPLLKMHAGLIEITPEHNGHLFFWHFANRQINGNKTRTILWLNGGPGCTSLEGALMELGPYRPTKDGKLERLTNGSWDEFANLLFVDQPVGTGYSYVSTDSYVHELTEAADQLVIFLEKFMEIFPEYLDTELYIAGESYAGQYIPYVGKAILDRNEKTETKWTLGGLMIGNGWLSVPEQYASYLPFALQSGVAKEGSKLALDLERLTVRCIEELKKPGAGAKVQVAHCDQILNTITSASSDDARYPAGCINIYDVRLSDSAPACGMNWPEVAPWTGPYLKRDDVMDALHVPRNIAPGWKECNDQVGYELRNQNSKSSITLFPELLSKQVRILLYSGDKDLICNHLGTEHLISNIRYNGGIGITKENGDQVDRLDWLYEGVKAGFWQTSRNLTYVLYHNASHMVPWDFPDRTLDMLNRFIGIDYSLVSTSQIPDSTIGGIPLYGSAGGDEDSMPKRPSLTDSDNPHGEEKEKERMKEVERKAYYKSGQIMIFIFIIAGVCFGIWIYRKRKRDSRRGVYSTLNNDVSPDERRSGRLNNLGLFNQQATVSKDIEAADFDEAELDNLDLGGRKRNARYDDHNNADDSFHVGEDSDNDSDDVKPNASNKMNGNAGNKTK